MSCAIIGDSIALGIAMLNPACYHDAVNGRSVESITTLRPPRADRTVISAGSNHPSRATVLRLENLRKRIRGRVTWILPANRYAYEIRNIAVKYGDCYVRVNPGRDGVHPRSYRVLNHKVRSQACF